MMNDKLSLLKRYFNDKYSRSDYLALKQMLDDNDSELENLMQSHWSEFQNEKLLKNKDLPSVLHQLNEIVETATKAGRYLLIYQKFSKIAAILLFPLLIALGFLYLQIDEYLFQKDVFVEVTSPLGARTSLNLPDGSMVWLNGNSWIRYPAVFAKNREVEMKGEAFFKVHSDEVHPFLVKSNALVVKATGTEFNVLAYDDDPEISVILKEGKVGVEDTKQTPIKKMQTGYKLKYNKITSDYDYKQIDANSYSGWINGKLIFENASLIEVCNRMERWYGVKIEIADSELLNLHFKATFMNENIEEAIKLLQSTATFQYQFAERKTDKNGVLESARIILSKN